MAPLLRLASGLHLAVLLVILVIVSSMTIRASSVKPLWHDEIYTLLLARLPSAAMIWAAHREGVDLAPPLNTFATRLTLRLFGTDLVSTRLPALLGYWTMTLIVFVMVRRRAGVILAVAAALIPVQTAAYRYSYEARPYGLALGLFALAIYCWTEAARGKRRYVHLPLLAAALAAGIWNHYYAALTAALIVSSEAVRQVHLRRIDRPMWLAFAAAGIGSLPLLPLAAGASGYAPHFWAQVGALRADEYYTFLLRPLTWLLFGAWGVTIVVVLAGEAVLDVLRNRSTPVSRSVPAAGDAPRVPLHEIVAITGAMLLPTAMFLAASLTRVFAPRYALPAVIGFALAIPLSIRWAAPRGVMAASLLAVALLIPVMNAMASSIDTATPRSPNPFEQRPLLAAALTSSGRVVCSGSLSFLQLWYYAPAELRGQLVYLADRDAAVRFTGSDTFERGYLALAKWTAVPVEPYGTFVERNPSFIVYASGSGWLLERLAEAGATIELVQSESGGRIYRVTK